jgi:hypothetical protein
MQGFGGEIWRKENTFKNIPLTILCAILALDNSRFSLGLWSFMMISGKLMSAFTVKLTLLFE